METQFDVMVADDGRAVLTDVVYPLRMAVVSNESAKRLTWNHSGIYILLGLPADGGWCAYVGKARDLSKRIAQPHPIEWSRALLVRRSEPHFDTAEIGWLEGRLHSLLETSGVDLKNKQTPGDETLNVARQEALKLYVGSIHSALALVGYDPAGLPQQATRQTAEVAQQDAKPTTAGKVHRKLLGYLPVGTVIKSTTSKYRGTTAKVEAAGILYGDKLYASPSAAAKAVTGTDTADGLAFWGVEDKSGKVSKLRDVRDGKIAIKRQRKTTPSKLTAAKRRRLFARHGEGATYVELQREFGMSQGGVYKVLKEGGRVQSR